jgi:hypothetical protein
MCTVRIEWPFAVAKVMERMKNGTFAMMKHLVTSSFLLWTIGACAEQVDQDQTETPPPIPDTDSSTTTPLDLTNVATVAVTMPDAAGVVHHAVAVVPKTIVDRVDWLLEDAVVVERPKELPPTGLSYQERLARAVKLAAEAVMAQPTDAAFLVVVFDEDTIGWSGPTKPVGMPDDAPAAFGCPCNYDLFVDSRTLQDHTVAYGCNAAFAHGTLSAGSQGTVRMKFFTNQWWPNGSEIFATPPQIISPGTGHNFYIWGQNNVFSWYYVEAFWQSGGGCQITNTMYCF